MELATPPPEMFALPSAGGGRADASGGGRGGQGGGGGALGRRDGGYDLRRGRGGPLTKLGRKAFETGIGLKKRVPEFQARVRFHSPYSSSTQTGV